MDRKEFSCRFKKARNSPRHQPVFVTSWHMLIMSSEHWLTLEVKQCPAPMLCLFHKDKLLPSWCLLHAKDSVRDKHWYPVYNLHRWEKGEKYREYSRPFYILLIHQGEETTVICNLTLSLVDQNEPLWKTHASSLFTRYFTTDPKNPWEFAGYTLDELCWCLISAWNQLW